MTIQEDSIKKIQETKLEELVILYLIELRVHFNRGKLWQYVNIQWVIMLNILQ